MLISFYEFWCLVIRNGFHKELRIILYVIYIGVRNCYLYHAIRMDKSGKFQEKGDYYHYRKDGIELHLEDFENIVPTKELFTYYREKYRQLSNDYYDLIDKVNSWQSTCDKNFQTEQELQHKVHETAKLQQAVSDLQLSIQDEREQMLRLRSENDRLKMQAVEDKRKIQLLLNVSDITEHEITYMIEAQPGSIPVPRIFPKHRMAADIGKARSQSDRSDGIGTLLHTEMDSMEIQARALQAELEEHIRFHTDHICTLMKDRDLIRREWNKERMAMQEQISQLSHRLKDTRDRLYDAMKELITIKKDNGNEQFQWRLEKQKMLQRLEHIKDKLGENYPSGLGVPLSGSGQTIRGKTNSEICAKLDSLKDIVREKEGLILMYQERCDDLERETDKHRNILEKARTNYRVNTQKLSCHVAYLKRKYEDLDRRRKLEAEGFYNDVKILRKRLENIEKTIQKFLKEEKFLELLSASGKTTKSKSAGIENQKLIQSVSPDMKLLVSTAADTSSKAVQLERELKRLMKRVEEIQQNLAS